MAAITPINATGAVGAFAAAAVTLTASDTLTVKPGKLQLLMLRNGTAGALTVVIDGDGGTSVTVPGIGSVAVSGGYSIALAAGESKAVILSSISAFTQGTVAVTGGTGASAQLIEI